MAQPFNSAVMTDSGAALLTRAQAGEIKIEFTRLAVGNGTYTDAEKELDALQEATALKSEKNSYTFSDISIYSDYSVKLTALITNQDPTTLETIITEGYYINEIGIFAKAADTDEEEILYSITTTTGDQGDFIPPYNGYSPAQITQDYYVTVNNSTEVTINTAGAALLAEDANKVTDDTTKQKYKIGIDNGIPYFEEVEE